MTAATSAVADEIRAGAPTAGVAVWWLGQAGFVLRSADATVVVDPFLTDYGSFGRTYPPPFEPERLSFADVVLGTHAHADHIDPEGFPRLLAAAPDAVAVVRAPAVDATAELGVERARLRGAEVDVRLELGGLRVTPFPALHGDRVADGYGFHLDANGRHPYLGYLVELGGIRFCHTGDTLVYEGLAERLRSYDPDVLAVPINGRSWFREQRDLVGVTNVFEAAELAEVSGAALTVPIHWDLFVDNREDPEHFVRYAALRHPGVRAHVPELGVRFDVTPRR